MPETRKVRSQKRQLEPLTEFEVEFLQAWRATDEKGKRRLERLIWACSDQYASGRALAAKVLSLSAARNSNYLSQSEYLERIDKLLDEAAQRH